MEAWLDNEGLTGFSKWMNKQADEETKHGMKIYGYLLSAGTELLLPAIPAPDSKFASAMDVGEKTLHHEITITESWRTISAFAQRDGDAATMALAQWFVTEQMEEEDRAVKLVQRLKLAGDRAGLLILDNELGAR
jgi:ferritin